MITSFTRPVTNNSPSRKNPRSPVRKKSPVAALDGRAEHLLGFLGAIPITLRHRRPLNENLADFAVRALARRLRIAR